MSNVNRKEFIPHELSKGQLLNFLISQKINIAMQKYGEDHYLDYYQNLSKFLSYKFYGASDFMMGYFYLISSNCDNDIIERFNSLYETEISSSIYQEFNGVENTELDFLRCLNKLPFNIRFAEFGPYKNNSKFKDVLSFFGVGVLPESLLDWLNDDSKSAAYIEDHIDTLVDLIEDEYINYRLNPIISDFIPLNCNESNAAKIDLLYKYHWGYEFNLYSIESNKIDKFIEAMKDKHQDFDILQDKLADLLLSLVPCAYKLSNVYIIDKSNPLFSIFNDNNGCKYKLVSLAVCDSNWEFNDNYVDGVKLGVLNDKINAFSEVISLFQ